MDAGVNRLSGLHHHSIHVNPPMYDSQQGISGLYINCLQVGPEGPAKGSAFVSMPAPVQVISVACVLVNGGRGPCIDGCRPSCLGGS